MCSLDIVGFDPLLLYTNHHDVVMYDLRNSTEISVLRETHKPTSLAFHYKKSLIFFTDVQRQRIYKFDRNNSKLTPIVSRNLAVSYITGICWMPFYTLSIIRVHPQLMWIGLMIKYIGLITMLVELSQQI